MEVITQLEAQVLPISKVVVKDGDKSTTYQLVLDYCAIAKAQTEIGKDLSVMSNWKGLSGPELSAVCWAALDRFHPEVTLRELRQWLGPAAHEQLFVMLFNSAYPGVLDKLIGDAKAPDEGERPNVAAAA